MGRSAIGPKLKSAVMGAMSVVAVAVSMFPLCSDALAQNLEELAREGYGVLMTTEVTGTFEGCEYGRGIPLDDGLIFVCSLYSYRYASQPEVLILKSVQSDDIKVLIDGEEFDGTLYRQ